MKTRKHKDHKEKDQHEKAIRNPEEMLPFVQIPTAKTESLHTNAKQIVVKPVMTNDQIKAREGTYFDDKGITIYDEDVDIYGLENGNKKLLARFRKNVFPKEMLELGWTAFYKTAAPSRNRGAAAGPIQVNSEYWKKRKPVEIKGWSALDANGGKMRVNNNVYSSVLGYFEQTAFMGLPCRLTSYTQKYFEQFKQGIPFLKEIDNCFKVLIPENHKKQFDRASQQPKYQIEGTAFSSITLNRNFRTALHRDAGDFREGYGNLSVIERGKYHGGFTLFPQYNIGFNVRTGDFLAMDVHEWHCNTEMRETAEDKEFNKPQRNYRKKER
jgi:hypothetical protein